MDPQEGCLRICEGVWLVQAPLNGINVCLYILSGSELAVVDTGYTYHPRRILAPALESLGLSIDDVRMILNTHGHPDHLGGNAALKSISGARVFLHSGDLDLATGPEAHFRSPTDTLVAMRSLGWTDEVSLREVYLRERIGRGGSVDEVLGDGDSIDLGSGLCLRVIHTPGHSAGSVTFYWEKEGIAFSGDSVQGWGVQPGIVPLYFQPQAYLASLKRLCDLPIATLCLGHSYEWSKSGEYRSPIRSGEDVRIMLRDSQEFLLALDRVVAEEARSTSPLRDNVFNVATALRAPFRVPIDQHGRINASSAATIMAHLRDPVAPQAI